MSQRVNKLLKMELEKERRQSLEEEAATFFRDSDDLKMRKAFQKAGIRAISCDEE
jgi:hypothetical protein